MDNEAGQILLLGFTTACRAPFKLNEIKQLTIHEILVRRKVKKDEPQNLICYFTSWERVRKKEESSLLSGASAGNHV